MRAWSRKGIYAPLRLANGTATCGEWPNLATRGFRLIGLHAPRQVCVITRYAAKLLAATPARFVSLASFCARNPSMIVNDQCEGHPFIPLTYPILSNSLRSSCFGDAWRRVVPSHTVAVNHQCEQSVEGDSLHLICSVWFAACSSSTSDCLHRRELPIPPVSLRPLSSKCRVYRMTTAIHDCLN